MGEGVAELVAFLNVQFDYEEAVAEAAAEAFAVWSQPDAPTPVAVGPYGEDLGELADHIARHDPARTLARVKAGRRLIERYERAVQVGGRSVSGFVNGQDDGYVQACLDAIRDAAAVYAGESGYREEWAADE